MYFSNHVTGSTEPFQSGNLNKMKKYTHTLAPQNMRHENGLTLVKFETSHEQNVHFIKREKKTHLHS